MRNLDFNLIEVILSDIIDLKRVRSIRESSRVFCISETKIRDVYNYLRKYNIIYSVYRRGYYLNPMYTNLLCQSKIINHEVTSNNYHKFITNTDVRIVINKSYVNSSFMPTNTLEIVLKMLEIDVEYALYNKYVVNEEELRVERYGVYDDYVVTQIIYDRATPIEWFL